MEKALSVKEVAELLQVPERTIYHLIKTGRGPRTYKLSRHIRILPSELSAWVRSMMQELEKPSQPNVKRPDFNRSPDTDSDCPQNEEGADTVPGDRSEIKSPTKENNHDNNIS